MKKRFFASLMYFFMAVSFATGSTAKLSCVQCECTCRWVCTNRCDFKCTDCGFIEGVEAAASCCQNASKDGAGPCSEESSY